MAFAVSVTLTAAASVAASVAASEGLVDSKPQIKASAEWVAQMMVGFESTSSAQVEQSGL